ncbi:chemotaxis protein CheB [Pontibacter sp. CAU 1760]
MNSPNTPNRIIAIGASAGGIDALYSFFDRTPLDQVAYVVIQHLSADYHSRLAELLKKHSQLQICVAEDHMLVEANRVYVIPSNAFLTIHQGRLQLADKLDQERPHLTIDTFFKSLAADQGDKAIGVILSGTGHDGSEGIGAIRKAGGLVLVQDPQTAQYDQMPKNAIATGWASAVQPPEAMPRVIRNYVQGTDLTGLDALSGEEKQTLQDTKKLSKAEETALVAIVDFLNGELPLDFSEYKRPTIFRRIRRRMALLQIKDATHYLLHLKEDPAELQALAKDFLISVTSFFRDSQAFEALEQKIIPAILGKGHEHVKIWVAGCATGEEAYSLAMLVAEYMEKTQHQAEVKIFATDLDQAALRVASKGVYPASSVRKLSPARQERFFTPVEEGFKVKKSIRQMLIFAYHDLIRNPPYCHVDLISCRNLLIYLNPALQKKVFGLLHFGLRQNGYLFLGSSEQTPMHELQFLEIDRKAKIYQKTSPSQPIQLGGFSLPLTGEGPSLEPYESLLPAEGQNLAASQAKQPAPLLAGNYLSESVISALFEHYHQVGVCLDENRRVVQAYGDLSPYLVSKGFNFNFNLMELMPQSLLVAFGTAFSQALQTQAPVAIGGVRNDLDDTSSIDLLIKPFVAARNNQKLMLLLLSPAGPPPNGWQKSSPFDAEQQTREYINHLEEELQQSKDSLLLASEKLAAYQENLQSFHEEMLSAGEEMQSGNEELQSLNEELQTINAEYHTKIKELTELNDDLNNYFRSNVGGQLFVDKNLLLKKFSPAAVQHINLQESDIGRPLHHLTTNIRFDTIADDIVEVLHKGGTLTKELQSTSGKWFEVTVMPYVRQADNQSDGAMVTFYDIHELVLARQKMEENAAAVLAVLEAMPQIACTTFPDGRIDYFNQHWYTYSGMSVEQTKESGWLPAVHPHDKKKLLRLWQQSLASGKSFQNEFRIRRGKDRSYRWHLARAVPIHNAAGEIIKWVSTATDIDNQRKLLEELTVTKNALLNTNGKLSRINVDLDNLVYIASHDLRSPVIALQELLKIATPKLEGLLEGEDAELVGMMQTSVAKLQQVINDLTRITQVQKETDLEKEAISFQEMLQDVLTDLEKPILESGALIHQDLLLDELVYARKNLRSILYNLLSNAIKYRSEERTLQVHLTFKMDPEGPLLQVVDNGLGISPTQLPKLFTAFKRFHSHVEGTGVGLYIIKRMVENNGGWIEVDSQEEVGTTFKVYFGQKAVSKKEAEGKEKR